MLVACPPASTGAGEGEGESQRDIEPPPRTADLDVDVDRDGDIDGDDDDGEDTLTTARGGIFIGNVDDDDGDGVRDSRDSKFDDDFEDMTEIVVQPITGLDGARVVMHIAPGVAAARVRLWSTEGVVVHEPASFEAEQPQEVDVAIAVAEDTAVSLFIEAIAGRTADWDGRLTLSMSIVIANEDAIASTDTIALRAAPVIFPDNTQAPRELYVLDIPQGQDNNSALVAALANVPAGAQLRAIDQAPFSGDRWMQDNMELGYQQRPSSTGRQEVTMAMNTERDYGGAGLDRFVPEAWLSANRGYYYPSGDQTSHNYGGNLEVIPPTDRYPLGRMIYGGGQLTLSGASNPDTMNDNQVAFLNAQEAQGPALEVSSEWLEVGHIDEWFQVVPVVEPAAGSRGFVVVVASPQLARDITQSLRDNGGGESLFFRTRDTTYSVNEVLDAPRFAATNDAAELRIQAQVERMKSEFDLVDDDFRFVPVFYIDEGSTLVSAFNPGIQNLVTMGNRLFIPDPEGPLNAGGVDVFRAATEAALADTGHDLIFVDVYESYHLLLGEAHCGTNVVREPYERAWWEVSP
jgi:protein-arginine deiminase